MSASQAPLPDHRQPHTLQRKITTAALRVQMSPRITPTRTKYLAALPAPN